VEAVMAGEAAVTDSAGKAEDTLLSVVVVTDSVVLTRLADSPGAASVQELERRGNFLAFLVAGVAAALVTAVSVDAVATFAILTGILSVSASMASDTRIITRTTTRIITRITIHTHIRTMTDIEA
jgi:hypothetical protein